MVHTLSNSSATFSLQQAFHKLEKNVLLLAEIAATLQHIYIRATSALLDELVLQKFPAVSFLCSSRILRDGVRLRDEPKRSLRKSYTTFPVFLFASVEERSSKNRERAIGKTSFSKHVKISSQNHVRCCLQKIGPCFINSSN